MRNLAAETFSWIPLRSRAIAVFLAWTVWRRWNHQMMPPATQASMKTSVEAANTSLATSVRRRSATRHETAIVTARTATIASRAKTGNDAFSDITIPDQRSVNDV